ncbi:hypothetical protein Taro_038271 [Colocasia esculenta]|uniref:Uncharacterized protein n=1 Tax=Colocasia esculenta TaxID=4460 RepID=A0A843WIR0_COLES|nr:hypothetical protein [Colocasia esculenta]
MSCMGIVIRLHCKIWQKVFSKLPEETKNGIFQDLEMWYCWDQTPQIDKEMLQHMIAMHKGWRGMLKLKHYKGKTFENVVASVPPGVDPSDWRTMCETWNTREEQERMTQMTTPSLQSDDVALISVKDAFIAVMGRDRPGHVCCAGKAETLRTWYGREEGLSSSSGYHTQV